MFETEGCVSELRFHSMQGVEVVDHEVGNDCFNTEDKLGSRNAMQYSVEFAHLLNKGMRSNGTSIIFS